ATGNVGVARATRNVLAVLEIAGARVPVYRGAATALSRRRLPPRALHGRDGLGNTALPPPRLAAEREPAQAALTRLLTAPQAAYTLVALGPLTNLAATLANRAARRGLRRLVVAAGAALDEFNLTADAEAAAYVLAETLPVTLVGRELSYGAARITPADHAALEATPSDSARLAGRLLRFLARSGRDRFGWQDGAAAAPDALALAIALDPTLISAVEPVAVTVVPEGATAGRLLLRERDAAGARAMLVHAIDAARYRQTLIAALRGAAP